MNKRFRAFLLAAMMVVSILPVMSFAADKTAVEFLAMANDGVINLEGNITLTEGLVINQNLIVNGNGYTITLPNTMRAIQIGTDNQAYTVEFNNVTLDGSFTGSQSRCIDIRSASDVTLDAVTLKVKNSSVNAQPLNLGGSTNGTKVTVKNSKIESSTSGYGIVCWVECELNVENTEITCYGGAIYMKKDSAGSVVNVTEGSVLNGINTHSGNGNGFGVIVCCGDDIVVNVEDSTINAECINETAPQFVVSFQTDPGETHVPANTTLNLTGNTVVNLENDLCRVIYDGSSGNNVTEIANATVTGPGAAVDENKQQIQESLAPGSAVDANGNVYVVPVYGGPPMNWVKCSAAENGVMKSGPLAASEGATITLYPKAAAGYVLDTVEVLDAEGNAVELNGLKFRVPLGGVTVNATFKPAN